MGQNLEISNKQFTKIILKIHLKKCIFIVSKHIIIEVKMMEQVVINNKKESALMPGVVKTDLRDVIGKIISVSDLSRGMASKVIQKVGQDKEQYIVVKNNKPEAVILSVEEYMELMEAKEDLELLQMADSRVKNYVPEATASHDDILNRYNIKEEKLDELMETVEIE
jgi:prevent-host-death family protein